MSLVQERLQDVAQRIAELRDMIGSRVGAPTPPLWCESRGWSEFLLALSDEDVTRGELTGLEELADELPGAPMSLRQLAASLRALRLPEAPPVDAPPLLRARARKAGQIAALVRLCRERLGPCLRLVDVGAGTGHLTRELARALNVPALGLERSAERVATAAALTGDDGPRFEAREIEETALDLQAGDLAVGLHACGSLGDALVRAAARDGVNLLLINCCLQKIDGSERAPISRQGQEAGLVLGRDVLGLTNLIAGRRLIEGDYAQVTEVRSTRYALRLLLRARGVDLPVGEEMRGLRRRHARHGLASLSARAFERRGLAPATAGELSQASAQAARDYGIIRRLSLPRAMLGRVLELAVALDRACYLEEAGGHEVSLERVFALDLSPRNLGIIARVSGG